MSSRQNQPTKKKRYVLQTTDNDQRKYSDIQRINLLVPKTKLIFNSQGNRWMYKTCMQENASIVADYHLRHLHEITGTFISSRIYCLHGNSLNITQHYSNGLNT
jgi:hypothetical protein